ncbi:MAG: hypothetical protein ACYCSW_01750 [bacterium]
MLFSAAISLSGCHKKPPSSPPPPAVSSNCAQNATTATTKMYSCGIQFTVSSTSGNTQTSGVSVIVANPQ